MDALETALQNEIDARQTAVKIAWNTDLPRGLNTGRCEEIAEYILRGGR